MDTNSIVTNEQCGQRVESFLKELGFIDRSHFVEESTWCGLNQGYVLDVAMMIQSDDDLVQSAR